MQTELAKHHHFSEPIETKNIKPMIDSRFKVNLLARTENPQTLAYKSMHQCYDEDFVSDESYNLSESRYGELCVKHLLNGNRGHFNPLEGPQISLNVGYFPHSVMQQVRTHRVGVTFSVQSFRYTGERILELGILGEQSKTSAKVNFNELFSSVEDIFYIRPEGHYTNREGKKYLVTEKHREDDLWECLQSAIRYRNSINVRGYSEEHARSLIPFDVRQHFTMSCNVRSLMHILDLRAKLDAQLECQYMCDLIAPHFKEWVPEIWNWYEQNRYKKARLAP